jgi:D-alanyl-D-alanine carboxypeptidase (penicillin-binding protein 5/6)
MNLLLPGYSALALLMLCFLTGFGPPRLVDQFESPTQWLTIGQLAAWQDARQPPPLSARAYLLYDVSADRTLFAQESTLALPPASLTKLMTALLILEQNALTVTVTVQASDLIGDASMGLAAGERLTVDQLLWGLLLPSGNDAAMALARHSAGRVEDFVARMNERAQQLGLAQSHFANPHGLDAPNHLSSAADLLLLTQTLWGYPRFRQIVATAEVTISGHLLQNTNELLTTFPGANGVKTGTTDAAGQCLVASIVRDGRPLLIVLLGSQDRYADLRTLYAHYGQNYQWVTGDPRALAALNRLYGPDGVLWPLRVLGEPPTRLLRPWELSNLRAFRWVQPPSATTNWQPGVEVGVLEWRLGNELLNRQSLVLW